MKMNAITWNDRIHAFNFSCKGRQNTKSTEKINLISLNYIPFNIWTSTVAVVELMIEHAYMPLCCRSALNIDKRLMIHPPVELLKIEKFIYKSCKVYPIFLFFFSVWLVSKKISSDFNNSFIKMDLNETLMGLLFFKNHKWLTSSWI